MNTEIGTGQPPTSVGSLSGNAAEKDRNNKLISYIADGIPLGTMISIFAIAMAFQTGGNLGATLIMSLLGLLMFIVLQSRLNRILKDEKQKRGLNFPLLFLSTGLYLIAAYCMQLINHVVSPDSYVELHIFFLILGIVLSVIAIILWLLSFINKIKKVAP